MITELVLGDQLCGMEVYVYPSTDYGANPLALSAYGRQRLPTDPIGTVILTLNNVVIGSRIHITPQTDTTNTLYDAVASSSTETISLSLYAYGSPLNDLRIRVRKGTSAPKYQPFETLATISSIPQSVYIAQVPDLIA